MLAMLTMDILIIFLTVVLVCTYSIAHRSDNPHGKGASYQVALIG